jgi:hypothetical protein
MGVMEKQTEEEKNRSKFLNNAEVRKEYQFIQRSMPSLSRLLALFHHLPHPLVTGRRARAPADVPAGSVALQRGHLRSAARRDREAEGGGQAGDPSRQCARLPQPFRVRRRHHPRFVVCVPLFLNPPTLTPPSVCWRLQRVRDSARPVRPGCPRRQRCWWLGRRTTSPRTRRAARPEARRGDPMRSTYTTASTCDLGRAFGAQD